MKLLFVKGKRGLAANHNGKFYFPDRNGCIKATGLYDCKITIDKDKLKSVYLIATRDLRISGCNFFYLKIKGLCDFLRKRF